jgi:hypothetical protein
VKGAERIGAQERGRECILINVLAAGIKVTNGSIHMLIALTAIFHLNKILAI